MILSFRCKRTKALFERTAVAPEWREIFGVALRKLNYLHAAKQPEDLRIPPSNRLERLKGDRKRQYSIRINKRWRICFEFDGGNAENVEIVDYH